MQIGMLLIARPLISAMFLLNFAEILQPKHSIFIAFQILRMIFILLIILLLSLKKKQPSHMCYHRCFILYSSAFKNNANVQTSI